VTAGAPADLDLVVRGGLVVTSSGQAVTDVGVRDGRIAQLGGVMTAAEEIDADGMLVLPGGVDMHVHLSPVEIGDESVPWADDFVSGSRAAAAGGVTTIGNITFPRPGERLTDLVERVAAEAARDSVVDFVLHPVLMRPDDRAVADIPALADGGTTSIKVFMSLGDFDQHAPGFVRAMAEAGRHGVLTMVHCEDACIIDHVTADLLAQGKGDLSHYGESRPEVSERVAVTRMIGFAEAADAPIYIVHLGSASALAEARAARARGQEVYVETRPIYLYFTEERFAGDDAPLYVGNPPLRGQKDRDALWAGLAAGHVHTCCTDHAAWTKEQKLDPTLTVATARPGMSDLETLMPLLYSEGVRTGRLSLQRFVEVTSTNAAKLFGLFPQKGTIAVGSDADLVVWDPEARRTVVGAEGRSSAGYSLYEGWEVVGAPHTTLRRGEVVFADGAVVDRVGGGRLVRRGPTRAL
jgi:dihydropyrimidinase